MDSREELVDTYARYSACAMYTGKKGVIGFACGVFGRHYQEYSGQFVKMQKKYLSELRYFLGKKAPKDIRERVTSDVEIHSLMRLSLLESLEAVLS